MNLFKALNLCGHEPSETSRDCLTTWFVYACLMEDVFLRLKLTQLRETRFDNVQQLNFKFICHGTHEIKLIAATAQLTTSTATASGRH